MGPPSGECSTAKRPAHILRRPKFFLPPSESPVPAHPWPHRKNAEPLPRQVESAAATSSSPGPMRLPHDQRACVPSLGNAQRLSLPAHLVICSAAQSASFAAPARPSVIPLWKAREG